MNTLESITQNELSQVLDLQQRAYETLLWLDNLSLLRNDILDRRTADVLRNTQSCMAWIEWHCGQIPQRLRPLPEEAEPFARLFSSFFQTSFRVEQRMHDGVPYYRITPSKDCAAGAKRLGRRNVPKALKRKRRNEANRLKLRAIGLLADDAGEGAAKAICEEESFNQDVLMWTYAVELVHRARADSHGPAAHLIWKEMDKPMRQRLTAQRVWNARDRLIAELAQQDTDLELVARVSNPCR